MPYVIPADFRSDSVQAWTRDITLTEADAGDAELTAVIASQSAFVDTWCDDHFEPEAGITMYLNGWGRTRLSVPKRIRALTSVATRNSDATYTAVTSTNYIVNASALGATLEGDVKINDEDWLRTTTSFVASGWTGAWPEGDQSVRLIGDFSWPVTPTAIKRALSLLVWDWFKPMEDVLRRVVTLNTVDATQNLTGRLPAAQQILDSYRRFSLQLA